MSLGVTQYVGESMRGYKYLDADGRAPFTATQWTPGQWVETAGAHPCREGVHACRAADLAHWFADSLWEVELDGEVVASRHKVVGSRGRLVRAIDGYPAAVRDLATIGAWRSRDRAVEGLRRTGDEALAARYAAASTLAEIAGLGGDADETTFAGRAAALASDAAYFAEYGLPAQSPFVSACAAGHAAAGPDGDQATYDAGYAAERNFQSSWLAERLGLD